MRQSFRRARVLGLTFLLALAGTVLVTGTASAAKSRQTLDVQSITQSCELSICARDAVSIPRNANVDTYCSHPRGGFNLTYTNPTFGRGGYIPVANFVNNTLNPAPCGSRSGILARTKIASNLGSCSGGGCVNFGGLQRDEQLRAFCHLPPDQPNSLLVYVPRTTNAGFVHTSDLTSIPNTPSCNQGF